MLQVINVTEKLVADNIDEYIQFSSSIAKPGKVRDEVIQKINKYSAKLFNDASVIDDWERILRSFHNQLYYPSILNHW
jgi:hypothetical protein